MRGGLVTCGTACAVIGSVLGIAWGAQAAGLEKPTRGERVAARSVAWLLRYRLVESTLHVNGSRAVNGSCLQGWIGKRGHLRRGTVLALDNGLTIVHAQPPIRVLGATRREPATLPLVQLELGGCPRVLAPRIGAALQSGTPLRVVNRSVGGRPALAFTVHEGRTTMTVFLQDGTYRPVAVEARSSRFHGRSRIRLVRATPRRLQAVLQGAAG
jgi:hypothetical protein